MKKEFRLTIEGLTFGIVGQVSKEDNTADTIYLGVKQANDKSEEFTLSIAVAHADLQHLARWIINCEAELMDRPRYK